MNDSTLHDLKEIRRFLCFTNYYKRFIDNYEQFIQPLSEIVKSGNFIWTSECQHAYEQLNDKIANIIPNLIE